MLTFQVTDHHLPGSRQVSETQELKSLLDNADLRNKEQEQVYSFH